MPGSNLTERSPTHKPVVARESPNSILDLCQAKWGIILHL